MRMLQYKLPLHDQCYVISTGMIEAACAFRPYEFLPIRFLPESSDDSINEIVRLVNQHDHFTSEQKQNIRQILQGLYSDCFVYAVEVRPESLKLMFTKGINIVLEKADVRFSVSHKDGKPDSECSVIMSEVTYRMRFFGFKRTRCVALIHEDFDGIRRDLQLTQGNSKEDDFAFISEYIDV